MLLRHCAQAVFHVNKICEESCVKTAIDFDYGWDQALLIWTYVTQELEEHVVHDNQNECWKGNTLWCLWKCCANWEVLQGKECSCCKEIEEAVNRIISGDIILLYSAGVNLIMALES